MAEDHSYSNSSPCVCMTAVAPRKRKNHRDKEKFTVKVHVIRAAFSINDADNRPFGKPFNYQTSVKKFEYSSKALLEADKHDIVSKIIQSPDIPFPLENVHWGSYDFPNSSSKPENEDEITARLSDILASNCLDETKVELDIRIREIETMTSEKYKAIRKEMDLEEERARKRKRPLHEWMLENQNKEEFSHWQKHLLELKDLGVDINKFLDLKAKKMTTDEETQEEPPLCSICMKNLEPGSPVVQLPCSESHIFHGFCIMSWLIRHPLNPTCPLCRFSLGSFKASST